MSNVEEVIKIRTAVVELKQRGRLLKLFVKGETPVVDVRETAFRSDALRTAFYIVSVPVVLVGNRCRIP